MASGRGGGGEYTSAERVNLCRAVMSVSQDSAVGADQGGDLFWKRIDIKVRELAVAPDSKLEDSVKASVLKRSRCGIMNYWKKTLHTEVNRFHGYFVMVNAINHSGWNDDDYFKAAVQVIDVIHLIEVGMSNFFFGQLYCAEINKAKAKKGSKKKITEFPFKASWLYLRGHEKWKSVFSPEGIKEREEEKKSRKRKNLDNVNIAKCTLYCFEGLIYLKVNMRVFSLL